MQASIAEARRKGKTKQATLKSDFHAHGSESSFWPNRLVRWRHQQLPKLVTSRFLSSHTKCVRIAWLQLLFVFYTFIFSIVLVCPRTLGVLRNLSGGGAKSTFCLSLSGCWRCNANRRTQNASPFLHHKKNAQCYGNSCIARVFPSEKTLHLANVSFSEHGYFKTG